MFLLSKLGSIDCYWQVMHDSDVINITVKELTKNDL